MDNLKMVVDLEKISDPSYDILDFDRHNDKHERCQVYYEHCSVRIPYFLFSKSRNTLNRLVSISKTCYEMSGLCSEDRIKDEMNMEKVVDEERRRSGRRKRHSTQKKTSVATNPIYEGL